ncbi:Esterase, SGNH hydrolase-type [Paramyrothecium foliicola]|nr:Esterase, SGNH hydrolase-type [Paramyrothecium foliicola]
MNFVERLKLRLRLRKAPPLSPGNRAASGDGPSPSPAPMVAPAQPKSLRILCFGDSLTYGYTNGGRDSCPYSLTLAERIAAALPDVKLEVITNGVSGDVATFARFAKRLETECEKRWFDWVIVLGGTNDLAYGIQPDKIFAALEAVWDIPLSRNSKVLALTVPECLSRNASVNARRAELNEMILSHQANNYHAFNLRVKIPYHSLSEADQEKYWDDGLHMTPAGYKWMGGFIGDELVELLSVEEQQASQQVSSTASRGRAPPGETEDGWVFEEEEGNPRQINQGYIVVRKKDLD